MKALVKFLAVVFLSSFVFVACDKDDDDDVTPVLLEGAEEYTAAGTLDAKSIKAFFVEQGQLELAEKVKYGVKIFKVKYKTAYKSDSISASGIIALPANPGKDDAFPVLGFQHGVIFSNSQAPSVNPLGDASRMAVYAASVGFVVGIPDYIGYGASQIYDHPFMIKKYMADVVIDFLRTTKEFIYTKKPCKINKRIFLYGYGEGATASLAALSRIEDKKLEINDLPVIATVCGSGAYNYLGFREWMVSQLKFDQPWYLAYMLDTYVKFGLVDLAYDDVFVSPYSSVISGIVNGERTVDQMNSLFGTKSVSEILNDDFEETNIFTTEEQYAPLRKALDENSVPAWPLKSEVTFYYGKADLWVPAQQTLVLYNQFTDLGVKSNLKISALEGLDHETALLPSFAKAVVSFKSY